MLLKVVIRNFSVENEYLNLILRFDGVTQAAASSSEFPHQSSALGKLSEGLIAVSGYTGPQENEIFPEFFLRVERTTMILFKSHVYIPERLRR